MARPARVGDVVHYVSVGTINGAIPGGVHWAAMVTEGGTAGIVSLVIFMPAGQAFRVGVGYDPAHSVGTWHWPEQGSGQGGGP